MSLQGHSLPKVWSTAHGHKFGVSTSNSSWEHGFISSIYSKFFEKWLKKNLKAPSQQKKTQPPPQNAFPVLKKGESEHHFQNADVTHFEWPFEENPGLTRVNPCSHGPH